MPEPFDSTPVSTFEELDPEPDQGRGLSHAREFVLGIALLLGVLAWVGYRWSEDQRLATRYHEAQRAESARDWDEAHSLYQSISGYRDSDSRARDAGKIISARDKNYELAVQATDKKDWPAAFQAASNVNIAQSGYKNTQALLDQARQQVYTEALSGTVALRTGGNQPGLYYRTSKGWVWLEGSDKYSEVRGLGPSGHIVYDIANPELVLPRQNSPGSATSGNPDSATPAQPVRKYMLASVHDDNLSFCQLAFNPGDYTFLVWGERGVWGLHYSLGYFPFQTLGLRTDYSGYTIDYQSYDSLAIRRVALEDQNWTVMDMAPNGDALLVGVPVYTGRGNFSTLHIYVTGPDGSHPRSIFSSSEGTRSAHFSPDGRYVLLSTYKPSDDYQTEEDWVVLVDLQTGAQRLLAQQVTSEDRGMSYPVASATFLTQGAFRGKILLFEWSPGNMAFSMPTPESVITLLDPAHPDIPLAQVEAPTYPPGPVWVGEGQGGKCLIVAWQDGIDNALPFAQVITAFRIEPGRPSIPYQLKLDANELLTSVALRNGKMLYTTREPSSFGGSGPATVAVRTFSLPPTGPSGVGPQPELLFSGQAPGVPNYSFYSDWAAGPQVLAYVQDGELHARTYDGPIDIPLEAGISNLYSFPYTAIHWLK